MALDLGIEFHNNHAAWGVTDPSVYLENNVAYTDGRVETHKHRPAVGVGWDGEFIYNHANQMSLW